MKRAIKMPSMVNPETGKESSRHTAFNETTWGRVTRSYLTTINRELKNEDMRKIMDEASAIADVYDNDGDGDESSDTDDERAHLAKGLDEDDDEF